jgi:hypothetical protein
MVTLEINKGSLILASVAFVFLLGIGFTVAYNSGNAGGNPAIMGHSFDEIQLLGCVNGQILKMVSGSWACAEDSSGSGIQTTPISCSANSQSSACSATCAGGYVVATWTCGVGQAPSISGQVASCSDYPFKGSAYGSGTCGPSA